MLLTLTQQTAVCTAQVVLTQYLQQSLLQEVAEGKAETLETPVADHQDLTLEELDLIQEQEMEEQLVAAAQVLAVTAVTQEGKVEVVELTD
jgi:hypothetical protein